MSSILEPHNLLYFFLHISGDTVIFIHRSIPAEDERWLDYEDSPPMWPEHTPAPSFGSRHQNPAPRGNAGNAKKSRLKQVYTMGKVSMVGMRKRSTMALCVRLHDGMAWKNGRIPVQSLLANPEQRPRPSFGLLPVIAYSTFLSLSPLSTPPQLHCIFYIFRAPISRISVHSTCEKDIE